MISHDRRDWWLALVIAVGFHVLLIGLVLRATASHRALADVRQDAPATPSPFPADSFPVAGVAPQWDPKFHYVRCDYQVLSSGHQAGLVRGSPRKPDRLGCSATLSLDRPVAMAEIEIEYDRNGEIVEIRGGPNFQGDETFAVVKRWGLARPRAGRQWLRTPVFQITIRAKKHTLTNGCAYEAKSRDRVVGHVNCDCRGSGNVSAAQGFPGCEG